MKTNGKPQARIVTIGPNREGLGTSASLETKNRIPQMRTFVDGTLSMHVNNGLIRIRAGPCVGDACNPCQ